MRANFAPATKMTFRQDTLTINTSGGERRFAIEIAETPGNRNTA